MNILVASDVQSESREAKGVIRTVTVENERWEDELIEVRRDAPEFHHWMRHHMAKNETLVKEKREMIWSKRIAKRKRWRVVQGRFWRFQKPK